MPTRGCQEVPLADWWAQWRIPSIGLGLTLVSAESLRATPCFNRASRRPSRRIARALFFSASPRAQAGIDPYASAVSDVYQDLFGEGSYIGKGIYDVDAFEAALAGRVPENALLSHDLFEGIFARAGLVTDIEFFEEFPVALRGRRGPPASLGAR